jgi:hypothetical protein
MLKNLGRSCLRKTTTANGDIGPMTTPFLRRELHNDPLILRSGFRSGRRRRDIERMLPVSRRARRSPIDNVNRQMTLNER